MLEVKADAIEQSFEAIKQEATGFVDQFIRRGIESGLETKAVGSRRDRRTRREVEADFVEQMSVEGMAVVARLRRGWQSSDTIAADSGRPVSSVAAIPGETTLALFDLPDLGLDQTAAPVLYIAASSPTGRWRSVPVEVDAGGAISLVQTAPRKTVLGTAKTVLAAGQPYLFDLKASLEVQLVDHGQWLESCDDQALVMGANLAVAGSEIIQFGLAEPIGPGRFRLSRLLRGRRGTEWAMALHSIGEAFAMIDGGALRRIDLPSSLQGAELHARPRGLADADAAPISKQVGAEALRPPSPTRLEARQVAGSGLHVSWVRRSRLGWAWLDEIDAPLGESRELYRATLEQGGTRLEVETSASSIVLSEPQLAPFEAGPASMSVQQIGDRAASRAATLAISLD